MRLKQNLLHLPPGMDIVTFVEFDGKPPISPDSGESGYFFLPLALARFARSSRLDG